MRKRNAEETQRNGQNEWQRAPQRVQKGNLQPSRQVKYKMKRARLHDGNGDENGNECARTQRSTGRKEVPAEANQESAR